MPAFIGVLKRLAKNGDVLNGTGFLVVGTMVMSASTIGGLQPSSWEGWNRLFLAACKQGN